MQELEQQARTLLNIQLTKSQLDALQIYEQELMAWNERMNLTAFRDPKQVRIKHFLDSLTCISAMPDPASARVIDVGTGAGFPGLPLKIVYPNMELTLVESVGKKAEFCRHIINKLGLSGVLVLQKRIELVGQMPDHRQHYDWALARAVAMMPVLVEYLLPLVRIGGSMLAMKGESAPAETQQAEHAIALFGGHLRVLIPIVLPGVVDQRYLVIVDKIAATPDIFPRKVGKPSKHPIQAKKPS